MGLIEWEEGHSGVGMVISLCECGTATLTVVQKDSTEATTGIDPSVCMAIFDAVRATLTLDALARSSSS